MEVRMNERQKRFVEEYLKDLNATQAALRAGYSPKSAKQWAGHLLRRPEIAEAVQEAIRKRSERTELSQDRVVRELAAIAFADAEDYQQVEGDALALRDLTQIGREQRRAIQGYRRGRFGPEIQLCDRMRALELLGKHLGMFEKQQEREGEGVRVELGEAEVFSG